jgi:S1-C subfamily serine protease
MHSLTPLLLFHMLAAATPAAPKTDVDAVLAAEQQRIDMISRVSPSVVCMYDSVKHGGGSGVIITPDGYGLTNFHVVAGMLDTRQGFGGLGDGVLYELEVLGVDPTGDVAMFRLKGSGILPHAPLGDSDTVQLGDTVFAMGNPFVMSEDYSPTVTMGIVTGVHRYQWGVGGNLTYSDCIQTDASINPGNSGGPLFNAKGEVIGINGRISINTRGRFNVGFGYAISSNQIRRFIPALRAGLVAKHGTLPATIGPDDNGALRFEQVGVGSNLSRAAVRIGDRFVSFDSVALQGPNHFVSLLGTYPADWPVVLETERDGQTFKPIVRLAAIEPKLRDEFTVDRNVNLREATRVLDHYRRAVRARQEDRAFTSARWKVARTIGGREQQTLKFLASDATDAAIEFKRMSADGETGTTLRIDAETATRREPGLEPAPLPTNDALVHSALFVLQRKLIHPLSEDELPNLSHAGPDSPTGRDDIAAAAAGDPWEVLEWKLTGSAIAQYSFDAATGHCARIRVIDAPTGAATVVELMDHRETGGWVWPTKAIVHGPDLDYADEFSDWEPAS